MKSALTVNSLIKPVIAFCLCVIAAYLLAAGFYKQTQKSDFLSITPDRSQYTHRLMVRLHDQTAKPTAPVLASLSKAAGVELSWFRTMSGNAHVLTMSDTLPLNKVYAVVEHLQRHPLVDIAEPDLWVTPILVPNDPQFFQQWHFVEDAGGTRVQNAWDITTGDAAIVVAVVDTGVLLDHPDLMGRTVPGYDFISLTNFANDGDGNDSDPSDPGNYSAGSLCAATNSTWHGSHVAGIIGAVSDNNTGITGVNWVSKILPVRVSGACGGFTADMVDGLRWAAGVDVAGAPTNMNPAHIINLSLASAGGCPSFVQAAVTDAVNAGALVIAGAGNNAANAANYHPANCVGAFTVAATTRSGEKASYTNSGASVDISAPGGDSSNQILSTKNDGATVPVNHIYGNLFGTSMATAHVSGIASLVWSIDITQSAAQVASYILTSARAFPDASCTMATCGAGIIDATAAVLAATGNIPPVAVSTTLNSNENQATTGTLIASDDDGDTLIYTIVTDAAKGIATITNANTGAYSYAPHTGLTGADSFTFKVNDGLEDSNTATVNVTIIDVNVAPVANAETVNSSEDLAITGTLNATDGDGDALTYAIVSDATKGTVVITNASTGAYQYTPNTNASGSDSFTFKVNDGVLDSNVASINVSITAVNDAPVADNASLSTSEDIMLNGILTASDVEADSLSYSIVSNGVKGNVQLTNAATGAYTYTPNANANGADSFSFKVNDGQLDSNIATVSVNITAVNDAPVAVATNLITDENVAQNGLLLANDTDGDALSYAIINNASKGTAVITNASTGAYTYTPSANAMGADSFTFKVNDGLLDSNVATVMVNIILVNVAPVASNSTLNTFEDITVDGGLNATDGDADALSYRIVTNASKGSAVITNASTGSYRYTPNPGATGTDSFTFKVNDGLLNSGLATVSVNIVLVNFPPVANDGNINTDENVVVNGSLSANDSDGDALNFSIVENGNKGTAVITNASTGAFSYSPDAGETGADHFTFKVNDGLLDSGIATATLFITPVNDAPVAMSDNFSILNNAPVTGTLSAVDADGDALTFSVVSNASKGTVVINNASTGFYTYTPDSGAVGVDSFTYLVSDGQADSDIAIVTFQLRQAIVKEDSAISGGSLNWLLILLLCLLPGLRFIPVGRV